jgi:predicted  nucleic acid-binding Zn-ribbon protein
LQTTIKRLKSSKKKQADALDKALEKLPKNLPNLEKAQIKLHGIKKTGRRYSPELKSLAISIYHDS